MKSRPVSISKTDKETDLISPDQTWQCILDESEVLEVLTCAVLWLGVYVCIIRFVCLLAGLSQTLRSLYSTRRAAGKKRDFLLFLYYMSCLHLSLLLVTPSKTLSYIFITGAQREL